MNGRGEALVRMEFPASGESPSSEAHIPPRVFILRREKLPDPVGLRFPGDPQRACKPPRTAQIYQVVAHPWLALETPAPRSPSLCTLLSPAASLRCWPSPGGPLLLRERTCVRKSWEGHFWLLRQARVRGIGSGRRESVLFGLPAFLLPLLLDFITFGGFCFCNSF